VNYSRHLRPPRSHTPCMCSTSNTRQECVSVEMLSGRPRAACPRIPTTRARGASLQTRGARTPAAPTASRPVSRTATDRPPGTAASAPPLPRLQLLHPAASAPARLRHWLRPPHFHSQRPGLRCQSARRRPRPAARPVERPRIGHLERQRRRPILPCLRLLRPASAAAGLLRWLRPPPRRPGRGLLQQLELLRPAAAAAAAAALRLLRPPPLRSGWGPLQRRHRCHLPPGDRARRQSGRDRTLQRRGQGAPGRRLLHRVRALQVRRRRGREVRVQGPQRVTEQRG